jgi:hypothetical protein
MRLLGSYNPLWSEVRVTLNSEGFMAIHTHIVAAMAAGLILASSAVLGNETSPQPVKQAVPARTPSCLIHTGSRIDTKGCRGTGRSYTGEDLERTGKTTAGEALPLLDPSITVHR